MARSNVGNGNSYLDLEIQTVGETADTITVRSLLYITSNPVSDSYNDLTITNSWGGTHRSGTFTVSGGYSRTLVWSHDSGHIKNYGKTSSIGFSASFSGVEYWGATLSVSQSFTVPARAYGAPAAVTNVKVSRSSDTSHTVSWTHNGTASAPYTTTDVQRRESSNGGSTWGAWANLSTGGAATRTSYTDTGTKANKTYQYQARGWSSHTSSGTYVASSAFHTTPSAPSAASLAQGSDTSKGFTWTNGAAGSKAQSNVSLCTNGTWGSEVSAGTGASATFTTAANNKYEARVRAYRASGTSNNTGLYSGYSTSGTIYSTPAAPTTPTVARTSDTATVVGWKLPASNSRQYNKVEVSTNAGSSWTQLSATIAAATTSYSHATAANGRYRYRISSLRGSLTSGSITTGDIFTTPAAPTNVTASRPAGSTTTTISWTAGAAYKDSATVQYSKNGGAWTNLATGLTGTSTTHTGTELGSTYKYRVFNVKASGGTTSTTLQSAATESPLVDIGAAAPTITAKSAQRGTDTGVVSDDGLRLLLKASFTIDTTGGNALSAATVSWKRKDGTSPSASYTFTSGTQLTGATNIDLTSNWVITWTVKDTLGRTTTATATVGPVVRTIHLNSHTNNVAVGKLGSKANTFEVALDAYFSKKILNFWPIGAIYLSTSATNPADQFGGEWVAWGTGRVPVGIDSTQTEFSTVEKTGGAKTHTLTAAEMPSHTHTQSAHTHTSAAHTHTLNHDHGSTTSESGGTGTTSNTGVNWPTNDGAGTGRLGLGTNWQGGGAPTMLIQQARTHTHAVDLPNFTGNTGSTTPGATGSTTPGATGSTTATNQATGGGGAHNNLQPYITCYMWRRTA